MFWLAGLNLILGFLIYFPSLNGYFLGEDYAWWQYLKGRSIFEVLRYFIVCPAKALAGFYHPLVGLFYWLDVNLSWLNPFRFHFTNLCLHFSNYVLVVALALFFFKKKLPRPALPAGGRPAGWPALLAGFLFIIFPFHSEAVAWIDGRHDLLTTFFYLLSFYLFLRWNENKKRILFGLSVFSFFLALSAKEMAVTLPVVLSISLLRFQANKHRVLTRLTPTVYYWLVLVFYFFLHAAYTGHFNPLGAVAHVSLIIPRVLIFYLIFLIISLFFFPKKSSVSLLAILIGVFYFPAAFTFTQERYLYLPSTMASIFLANFFFLFWCWAARRRCRFWRQTAKGLLILALILGSAISANHLGKRVGDWKKASEIAQRVVNDFQTQARDIPEDSTIYFFNLPDNYQGSYIFRTHTAQAMQYGSGKKFKKIVVLPRTLGVGESEVEVLNKNKLILKSEDGYLIFEPAISQILPWGKKVIETEDYFLIVEDQNNLNLTLKKDYLGKEGVWFFKYRTALIGIR